MAFILGMINGITALIFSTYLKIDFLTTFIIFIVVGLVNLYGGIRIEHKQKQINREK